MLDTNMAVAFPSKLHVFRNDLRRKVKPEYHPPSYIGVHGWEWSDGGFLIAHVFVQRCTDEWRRESRPDARNLGTAALDLATVMVVERRWRIDGASSNFSCRPTVALSVQLDKSTKTNF